MKTKLRKQRPQNQKDLKQKTTQEIFVRYFTITKKQIEGVNETKR